MANIQDAVNSNNSRMLQLLVSVPGTYNPKDLHHGLFQAAKLGFQCCVLCLLQAGADINFVNGTNNTPLLIAVKNNKTDVVRTLLQKQCDSNLRGGLKTAAINIAARNGNADIVQLLVEHGAVIDSRDGDKNTPLILASMYGHYIVMKYLISSGCNINAVNNDGCTALHYACHKARGFQLLLDAGANPDITNNDSMTALMMAASEGFDGVVKALVEAKCDVNIPNNSVKKTALHILSFKGHAESIATLIDGGANIDVSDRFGKTPLWYAIQNKKVDVVRLLLKSYSCADSFRCSFSSNDDSCPAKLAFKNQMFDVVKFFILTGYDHCHVRECLLNNEFENWLKINKEFCNWVEFGTGTQTLKQLCRRWIRHHLGRQFFHHLQHLPIPDVLKRYLFLEELHEH